jgi:hypothetical protein
MTTPCREGLPHQDMDPLTAGATVACANVSRTLFEPQRSTKSARGVLQRKSYEIMSIYLCLCIHEYTRRLYYECLMVI